MSAANMENVIPDGNEYIYFVSEEPFTRFVKIGKTNSIDKRISMLQTGNPRKLNVLLTFERPKKYDYEKVFHKLFFNKCVRGEWYSLSMDTLIRIEIIMKKNNAESELSSLFAEFMNYESCWIIENDKLFVNCPLKNTNRCGSKLHGIISVEKIKKGVKMAKREKMSREIKLLNFKCTAEAEEIAHDKVEELIVKNRMSKVERSTVNKYLLRTNYKYAGEMNEEWVKKYSDASILSMNKHIESRDTPINELAAASDDMIESMTDVERMTKRKNSFMYNVARTKIRDLYDKHNKTIDLPVKLMEYVNNQIKINNPIFGSKELKTSNTKFVLSAVNDVLNVVGYEIRIKGIYKNTHSGKKIYEFEWFDIAPNYYNLPETIEKDLLKPDFPKMKPPNQAKYAELL